VRSDIRGTPARYRLLAGVEYQSGQHDSAIALSEPARKRRTVAAAGNNEDDNNNEDQYRRARRDSHAEHRVHTNHLEDDPEARVPCGHS
jgi:hypothetical protein